MIIKKSRVVKVKVNGKIFKIKQVSERSPRYEEVLKTLDEINNYLKQGEMVLVRVYGVYGSKMIPMWQEIKNIEELKELVFKRVEEN